MCTCIRVAKLRIVYVHVAFFVAVMFQLCIHELQCVHVKRVFSIKYIFVFSFYFSLKFTKFKMFVCIPVCVFLYWVFGLLLHVHRFFSFSEKGVSVDFFSNIQNFNTTQNNN